MIKYAKIINEETKICQVGIGTNTSFYESIGMVEMDVEKSYDGAWYITGYAPQQTIDEQNESIKQQRQAMFEKESDVIKNDMDEAFVKYGATSEEYLTLAAQWLAKKDEIRNDLEYITEE